jgi:hypothetical protein
MTMRDGALLQQALAALQRGDAAGAERLLDLAWQQGEPMALRLLTALQLQTAGVDAARRALARRSESPQQAAHAQLLDAELLCFHSPGASTRDWVAPLLSAAAAGLAQAQWIVALYAQWPSRDAAARGADADDPKRSPPGVEELAATVDGWRVAAGEPLAEGSDVAPMLYRDFAPVAMLDWVRHALSPRLKPSLVIDPSTGQRIAHPVRRNAMAQWLPDLLGWPGKLLEQRLAATGHYPVTRGEVSNLLSYGPGEQYRLHTDCLPPSQLAAEQARTQGGQRVLTQLLGLAAPPAAGGETEFPRLGVRARLGAGDLLAFRNVDGAGQPLAASAHAGLAVGDGRKLILSKWVREHDTPYGRALALTL